MKKKHLNILLIILVIGIWGKLIYSYSKRFTKPKIDTVQRKNLSNLGNYLKIKKNKFNLVELQRDPFLNKTVVKNKKTKKIKRHTSATKKTKYFNWPNIEYIGFLNNKANSKLAILKINDIIKNCKESSLIDEKIYIRKIYRDSVKLEANNQVITIKK